MMMVVVVMVMVMLLLLLLLLRRWGRRRRRRLQRWLFRVGRLGPGRGWVPLVRGGIVVRRDGLLTWREGGGGPVEGGEAVRRRGRGRRRQRERRRARRMRMARVVSGSVVGAVGGRQRRDCIGRSRGRMGRERRPVLTGRHEGRSSRVALGVVLIGRWLARRRRRARRRIHEISRRRWFSQGRRSGSNDSNGMRSILRLLEWWRRLINGRWSRREATVGFVHGRYSTSLERQKSRRRDPMDPAGRPSLALPRLLASAVETAEDVDSLAAKWRRCWKLFPTPNETTATMSKEPRRRSSDGTSSGCGRRRWRPKSTRGPDEQTP